MSVRGSSRNDSAHQEHHAFVAEHVDRYFATAIKRQHIYQRRKTGKDPVSGKPYVIKGIGHWTTDPIFQEFRFCNVYREQDTVTEWVDFHIRKRFEDHPDLWFMLALARFTNYIPTLTVLEHAGLFNRWNSKAAVKALNKIEGKVFTSAYIINGALGGPKIEQIMSKVLDPLYKDPPPRIATTLEDTFNQFLPYMGLGKFMVYEIVSDYRHTRYLKNAPDILTWANAGPGAKRGLNRLLGMDKRSPLSIPSMLSMMQELLRLSRRAIPKWMPAWEMREVEHWLCEYDKYERVRLGQGRPRQKFKGG